MKKPLLETIAGEQTTLKTAALVLAACSMVLAVPDAEAAGGNGKYCSKTASLALNACKSEVKDDYWIAKANCLNISDSGERAACDTDAKDDQKEGKLLCKEQKKARNELCDLIGQGQYDPDFDPANFVDPDDIGDTEPVNPYFPLIPGARWVYEGGDEVITVVVTDKTKLIDGVTCRVVNDLVEDEGVVIEDTDDWYAQHTNGDIWYCGELARDFETFDGDDPDDPELVEIEGSFKAGRDGDKAGILLPFSPQVGDVYRQEMSLGNAEDAAEVISITGTEEAPEAGVSCSSNCLVTRDFSPIAPGVEENKYYVPGIGLILETDEGDRTELVDFFIP
jgi:hypothetical protein